MLLLFLSIKNIIIRIYGNLCMVYNTKLTFFFEILVINKVYCKRVFLNII